VVASLIRALLWDVKGNDVSGGDVSGGEVSGVEPNESEVQEATHGTNLQAGLYNKLVEGLTHRDNILVAAPREHLYLV
jgi:hypothetical protein